MAVAEENRPEESPKRIARKERKKPKAITIEDATNFSGDFRAGPLCLYFPVVLSGRSFCLFGLFGRCFSGFFLLRTRTVRPSDL